MQWGLGYNVLFDRLHAVDLAVASSGTLISVPGCVELVAHGKLQSSAVELGVLEEIETVVVTKDAHLAAVKEIVTLKHEREPILEEGFGDACIDDVLVPGNFEVLIVSFALENAIEGEQIPFRQCEGVVKRNDGNGFLHRYLLAPYLHLKPLS